MTSEIKDGKTVPFGVKIAIWITCAILYLTQVLPVLYRFSMQATDSVMAYVGIGVMAVGLLLETAADIQKNNAKKKNPRRFVDTGLYRIVRCPNYFGEVLMWTGSFIICIGSCCTAGQWAIAALGYIGIGYVMFSGARRIELRQKDVYGSDPEFQKYIKKTPLILPFIPIYSVARHSWLKG